MESLFIFKLKYCDRSLLTVLNTWQ